MNVRSLIAALLAAADEDFDRQVYLAPTADPVDAVESCPGDTAFALSPYIVIRGTR